MSMLGPVGAIIGGLLGKSLTDNKQELAQQMGAIPGATAPIGPERDFEKLSQEAYGKSIAEMAGILGGPQGSVTPTFSYGFNPGFVDVVTGGTFNTAGIAVNEDGSMATQNGVPSYASFSDFVDAMAASAKTGYYGGPVSKAEYDNMSQKGKDLYDAYATETNQKSHADPDVEDISDDVDTTPSPLDPSGIDFGVSDPPPSDTITDDRPEEPIDDSTAIDDGSYQGPGYDDPFDDGGGESGDDDPGDDSSDNVGSEEDPGSYGASEGSFGGMGDFKQGGLASRKIKVKRMKRGGLASR